MTRQVLVDPEAAAVAIDRPRSTIDRWGHLGWITKHGTRRSRLYDLAEVQKVATKLAQRGHPTPRHRKDQPHG